MCIRDRPKTRSTPPFWESSCGEFDSAQTKNALVGVCDLNLKNAQSFAAVWGIPAVFSTLEAILNRLHLNSVHILVPPNLHYPLTKLALEAGVHVLVEKPPG